ncbi:large subunit ribosomal protein L25 [Methylomarinovum caldicuralii]|uniref:Large ribosomal subunit protein bL25 n=1 Tax=Methylomarinovum caldicuralii TaxID=438856 RepID=A0AAU9CG77_9GAMM|nr:50S ribosomal protein L25/general stress protein Ctc [Methylomarinovum caldicuralii]BCX80551.1 large subunit ribosomal protein L25 [Methylomarinovum caldicuralii]
MEVSFEFEAEVRSEAGTRAARRLRRELKIPAVLYGGEEQPLPLTLSKPQVDKNLEQEAVYSHILTLKIPGQAPVQAILKEVQRHPSKEAVLHLDFQRVYADEEIRVHVPLHFVNEDTSVGVKKGGIVNHHLVEVEIACLPGQLPEFIEVDLANLDVGESIHLSELKLPEGAKVVELLHGADAPVVTILPPRVETESGESGEGEEAAGEA